MLFQDPGLDRLERAGLIPDCDRFPGGQCARGNGTPTVRGKCFRSCPPGSIVVSSTVPPEREVAASRPHAETMENSSNRTSRTVLRRFMKTRSSPKDDLECAS